MKRFGEYPPNSNTDPLEEIWAQEKVRAQNTARTGDQKTREICDEVAAAIHNSSGEKLAWNTPSTTARTARPSASSGRRKKRRRRRARRVLTTVFFVILLLVVGVFAAYKILIKPPEIGNSLRTGDSISVDGANDTNEDDSRLLNAGRKNGVYTFLIVGMDQASGSTDTILVGALDTKNETLNVVSIPRDTLVNVSWSVKKINSVYGSTDGINGLMDELENIMGFRIDSYGVVNLEAFEKIVDTIGGVYYDVPVDMQYYDPTQDLDINIAAGEQWLSGEKALQVVRYRAGYADGDIGRIGTQQDFLMTVAKQMLSIGNIPNLPALAQIYTEYVDTNLTTSNVIWYAKEFLKLDSEDITFQTLPGNYNDSINGGSYVSIYIDEWIALVNSCLNPYNEEVTVENLDILTRNSAGGLYATSGTIQGEGNFYNYN
ncbi:MAG: LCP family protein [Oscillospiraceae bacterium]|jgi:LCP family protein required for cell wall assembly